MPGPSDWTTRPGINRAGTGLANGWIEAPAGLPRLSQVFACPGWVMNQVLLLTAAPCSVTRGPCPEMGLSLASSSDYCQPQEGNRAGMSWCDRTSQPPAGQSSGLILSQCHPTTSLLKGRGTERGDRGETSPLSPHLACLTPHFWSVWPLCLMHLRSSSAKPSPLPMPPKIRFKEAIGPRNQDPGGT